MVCMAGLQVFIVRFFFQGARKGEFGDILTWSWKDLLTGVFRICMNNGQGALRGLLYLDIVCRFQYPLPGSKSATTDQVTAAAFTKQSTALLQCAPAI